MEWTQTATTRHEQHKESVIKVYTNPMYQHASPGGDSGDLLQAPTLSWVVGWGIPLRLDPRMPRIAQDGGVVLRVGGGTGGCRTAARSGFCHGDSQPRSLQIFFILAMILYMASMERFHA